MEQMCFQMSPESREIGDVTKAAGSKFQTAGAAK